MNIRPEMIPVVRLLTGVFGPFCSISYTRSFLSVLIQALVRDTSERRRHSEKGTIERQCNDLHNFGLHILKVFTIFENR
jgi:hypothetical protein